MLRCLVWLGFCGLLLTQSGCGGGGDSGSVSRTETSEVASTPAPPLPLPPPPAPPGEDQEPSPPAPEPAPPTDTGEQPETQPAAQPDDPEEKSMENLEWLAEVMGEYHDKYGHFPPAAVYDAEGRPLLSWRVAVLPWLDEEELYGQFHLDEPWDSPHNKPLAARMPEIYKTPSGPAAPKTCYLVPVGLGTVFSERQGVRRSAVRDGLSNTLMVVEADADRAVIWTRPEDLRFIPAQPAAGLGGLREGGFIAAAGDAVPYKIPLTLEAEVLRALFTYNGREAVDLATLTREPGKAAPAAPPGGELLNRARRAMAEGREKQGLDCLWADAVVRADEQVLGTLLWSPGLKRPMLAARWGFAVQSSLPANVPDDAPAGRIQPRAGPGRNLDPGRDRDAGRPGGETEVAVPGSLQAGDPLGFWHQTIDEPLIERLQDRVAEGYFGQWFQKFDAAEAEKRADDRQPLRRLPGMVLLGVTEPVQLRRVTLEEGLDLMLVAHLSARASRRTPGQTVYVLRILDAARDAVLWTSKPLSNLQIAAAGRTGARDPAVELIDKVMQYVDQNLRLVEIPELAREKSGQRAAYLAGRKYDNPLPVLMELRYYQWKQLLTPEELSGYYTQILGPDGGPRLATGTEAQRRLVIDRFLPRE